MNMLLRCGFAALVAGTALQAAPAAASGYDGKWSVSVVTEKGSCDAYRWDLGIAGGRIDERGSWRRRVATSISAAQCALCSPRGRINWPRPACSPTLMARAAGTLPNRQCSGRWSAEKRS